MSILIKGIKRPKNCDECPLADSYLACDARSINCPLVEVPTPHGRLIDADALYEQTAEWEAQSLAQVKKHDPRAEDQTWGWAHWSVVLVERTAFKHDIADAPSIIEAEKGEENERL